MNNATSLPPAGWYPDTSAPGQERWWDGSAWTAHSRAQPVAHAHRPQSSSAAIRCPRCGSGDAKTLSAVREQGTSTGRGTTTGWVSGNGDQPGHSATFSTTTTSYTAAARAAAPPQKRQTGLILIVGSPLLAALLGVIWAMVLHSDQMTVVAIAIAIVIAVAGVLIGCVLLPGDLTYNRNEFPEAFRRWSRSWSCQRCGEVFVV